MQRPVAFVAASLVGMLVLTGCTPAAPVVVEQETFVPAPVEPEPAPAATANAPEGDELLFISATATAEDGSKLLLETQVHQAIPYDDVAGQTLPAGVLEDCPSTLTPNLLRDEAWSFTRVNTSAITEGSWPVGLRINASPSAQTADIAGRGILQSDVITGDDACKQDKFLTEQGNGAMAVGIPGDTVGDASRFTRWAELSYGYLVPPGLVLSDCVVQVTDLGRQFGAESGAWRVVSDAASCLAGGPS